MEQELHKAQARRTERPVGVVVSPNAPRCDALVGSVETGEGGGEVFRCRHSGPVVISARFGWLVG